MRAGSSPTRERGLTESLGPRLGEFEGELSVKIPASIPPTHSEAKKKAYVRVGSTLRLYAMANHPSVSGFGLLVHRMGCSAQGSKMLTDTSSLPTLGLTSHHQVRVRVRARARTRPLLGSPSAAIHLSTIFS